MASAGGLSSRRLAGFRFPLKEHRRPRGYGSDAYSSYGFRSGAQPRRKSTVRRLLRPTECGVCLRPEDGDARHTGQKTNAKGEGRQGAKIPKVSLIPAPGAARGCARNPTQRALKARFMTPARGVAQKPGFQAVWIRRCSLTTRQADRGFGRTNGYWWWRGRSVCVGGASAASL